MGARSSGREAALQILYAVETSGDGPAESIREFWRELPGDAEGREYADSLVTGVCEELGRVDQCISSASTNWRLERMTPVDRNVLRVGAWELLNRAEVPRAVIIDEGVEIAKRYGTESSGAFVNGVLDRIAEDCGRRDDDRES